jgi:LuxR family maltose regulon positive regulatory protein
MLQIARVKLNRPRPTAELLRRPRLIAALNAGLDVPLTFISAPAGFGKTTLLLDWLDDVALPAAWLSLEENDDTLDGFVGYLVAAIQTIFPGALNPVLGLLQGPFAEAPVRLAGVLSDELAELPENFILVLDDYHLLKTPEIQAMMNVLLRHLPACLRLVIAARHDVPLPLARLHADGKICELRSSDLRFTPEEMRELWTRMVKRALPPGTLDGLLEHTEGWAAGIRFAALTLRPEENGNGALRFSKTSGERHQTEYFLNEIFLRQTPAAQEFLLKTSLLERFTAKTCDALINGASGGNSRVILSQLVHDEIMVTALDDNGDWYRYYHLFRDFLRSRAALTYNAEAIAELYRRASQWSASQGLFTDAIEYAIAAEDFAGAARLLGQGLRPDLDRETARPLLESWFRLFPLQEWDRHLGLVMAQLWLAVYQFRIPVMVKLIPLAEQLLAEAQDLDDAERKHYVGEIAHMKTALAFFANQPARVLELSAQALDNLPSSSVYARGSVLGYRAISYQMMGEAATGSNLLTETFRQYAGDSPFFLLRLLLGLGWMQLNTADFYGLVETAERMLELAKDKSYLTLGWAHNFLGIVRYEWNQLQAAAQHFALGAELRRSSNIKISYESFAWLALARQAQGFSGMAAATLQEVSLFSDEMQLPDLVLSTEAYRARLALLQGGNATALHWAESASLPPTPHMMWEIEHHLTRLRILLATRKPEMVRTVLAESNTLLDLALHVHDSRRTIQLYVLQAMALDGLGQTERALDALQKSIGLAADAGFKRTYLDLGPRMARLLDLLRTRNVAPSYLQDLLSSVSQSALGTFSVTAAETAPTPLLEPLTAREMQVLECLAKRMTTKEIATILVISPLTVKSHTDHIYSKLNVNNRSDAVRVGLAHGLLRKPLEF